MMNFLADTEIIEHGTLNMAGKSATTLQSLQLTHEMFSNYVSLERSDQKKSTGRTSIALKLCCKIPKGKKVMTCSLLESRLEAC